MAHWIASSRIKREDTGEKTAEEYKEYYTIGYESTFTGLTITADSITFYEGDTARTGTYAYSGYQILTYESGRKKASATCLNGRMMPKLHRSTSSSAITSSNRPHPRTSTFIWETIATQRFWRRWTTGRLSTRPGWMGTKSSRRCCTTERIVVHRELCSGEQRLRRS